MTWHLVTTDFPPQDGGVATWSEGMARALHAAGETVWVHAREPGSPPRPYRVTRMWGRSWARWGGHWAAASVAPRLRAGDRVLAATWPLARLLFRRAGALGVPVFVAWHGSDLTRPPLVDGLAEVRARGIHVPVSAYLGGLIGAPYTVLPCPIEAEPPAARGERLLVVARLGPLKGVDRAVRLAGRLRRPITIVGEGPERDSLTMLAAELGVDATFTGALPRAAIPWGGAWAVVLLSRPDVVDRADGGPVGWRAPPGGEGQEGLGLVLLEAAARGLPSIGSRTGGVPEAATVVLDDPEHDPIPTFPDPAEITAGLVARHGGARAVEVLRGLAASAPDQIS